ncbi:uncharacterized protein LOC113333637 [Papaver somniferum]|uniref:uncharacterized protein LOC113333637 n=1 Tax=Papaver somniferum TaxID=3469 RepID=UPI000E6FF01E|nr:uncharacterized protein LOC113333637 [Papaver somniferum]
MENIMLHDWLINKFLSATNNSVSQVVNVDKIATALWIIWKVRCSLIFDNVQVNVQETKRRINREFNEWLIHRPIQHSRSQNTDTELLSSKAPDQGVFKINFDETFYKETGNIGLGLIWRGFADSCHGVICIPTTAVDAEQAEALALLEAIKWAKEVGLKEVQFEGDCNNVVMAVNGTIGSVH